MRTCPKCGNAIISWNSWFQAWICESCDYMERKHSDVYESTKEKIETTWSQWQIDLYNNNLSAHGERLIKK